MRTIWTFTGLFATGAIVATCAGTPASPPPAASSPSATQSAAASDEPSFVGKTWLSTDEAAPRGTIRIFLPDGTLVMDSCWETYRLARWRPLADERIAWDEDGAPIEAEVVESTASSLQLRLRLVSETKDERYRLADAPYVCPDLPR